MDYLRDYFPYNVQHPPHPAFFQPPPCTSFPGHPQHHPSVDDFYRPFAHSEYTDFMPHHDEFEEVGEVSTRSRLTREQADLLESHFQANHKPNSTVKRDLAVQTNLTLQRVANWFQNRRAKAKQQRKQEKLENNQPSAGASAGDDDDEDPEDLAGEVAESAPVGPDTTQDSPATGARAESQRSTKHTSAQEAGWASLQRALRQAELAKNQEQLLHQTQMHRTSSVEAARIFFAQQQGQAHELPQQQWQNAFQDTSFDFGFGQSEPSEMYQNTMGEMPPPNFVPNYAPTSQPVWPESLSTPTEAHFLGSPDLPLPEYPGSRRGSAADSLSANFGTFDLASESPPVLPESAGRPFETMRQSEAPIDIAARRKGPRPAALGPAALRSRSYGALTSVSPTFRQGLTPVANTVRHVKSTGHSLNARFSGIRKASSAQRSPINIATFAEAEAFQQLRAQQAALAACAQEVQLHTPNHFTPVVSPGLSINTQLPLDEHPSFLPQRHELAGRHQLPTTQHLTLATASPPVTPFGTEFAYSHQHLSMPPLSAPPQYATFPDCTPPYSAGPLTNSSCSDAPFPSPDISSYPPVTYIPSLNHTQKVESPQSHVQQFVLPSDNRHDLGSRVSTPEQKKTEFCIQEFPGQKEEHAHVAQQLAQNRPRNFVFANTAPSDYDQS